LGTRARFEILDSSKTALANCSMVAGGDVKVMLDILEEHFEELEFLWLQRDLAIAAPDYDLADLAELDERVEAHIDGLRIAGDAGWEIAKEQLVGDEAGEVFTGAVLAFESGDEHRICEVLEVASQSMELARGAISALGWLTYQQAQPHIQKLIKSDEPMRRRIGIAAAAVHRQNPGPSLNKAVSDGEVLVRARALRAVGELGRMDLLAAVKSHLQAEDESCRFWAAWSASLLNDRSGIGILRDTAEAGGLLAERACQVAARRMGQAEAMQWQKQLAEREQHHRLAIIAAGAIGEPVLMPWLIEMMKVKDMARPAGEAFSTITGVDIAYENLEAEGPESPEAGPTETAEESAEMESAEDAEMESDEDLEMEVDPDEDLPWPEPELISKWWSCNQGRFPAGRRHLGGKPIVFETLREVLKTGKQRQRAAAALEMVFLQPGQPLFEVRARADRQLQAIGSNPAGRT
jgi:uncharacterized protein (TIGR02270 family)